MFGIISYVLGLSHLWSGVLPVNFDYALKDKAPCADDTSLLEFVSFLCDKGMTALGSIHQRDIVHNDIKSSNIRAVIGIHGDRCDLKLHDMNLKLIDLGLAGVGKGNPDNGTFWYRLKDWMKGQKTDCKCIDFFALSQIVLHYLLQWPLSNCKLNGERRPLSTTVQDESAEGKLYRSTLFTVWKRASDRPSGPGWIEFFFKKEAASTNLRKEVEEKSMSSEFLSAFAKLDTKVKSFF